MYKTFTLYEDQLNAINHGIVTEEELIFYYEVSNKHKAGKATNEERKQRKDILKRYNNFLYQY